MKAAQKKTPAAPPAAPVRRSRTESTPDVALMVESIIRCKWSLHVLDQVRRGVNRPGLLVRSTPGLTTKVLSERLDKMIRFGIFRKVSYPEIPPRVEYFLTPFGEKFLRIIDAVEELKRDVGTTRAND